MRVRKAIIPAAGLGTRLLPASKVLPKEMLPVVDKPAIQHVVEEAAAAGIREILIITSRGKGIIADHFDRAPELLQALAGKNKPDLVAAAAAGTDLADIFFLRQQEARGLGHAVACARSFAGGEPIAVLLPDDLVAARVPCLSQLLAVFQRRGRSVVAVQSVDPAQVDRYGVISARAIIEPNLFAVERLVEKPAPAEAPSNLAVIGRYVLTPKIFTYLADATSGKDGEIQLTDALDRVAATEGVYAWQFEGTRFDVGNKVGWLQANIELALQHPELSVWLRSYLDALAQGAGAQLQNSPGGGEA